MAPETLSQRSLNRALLARQSLLELSIAPLARVLEQVGGLQTQYAPSGYIGLCSRMAGFERRMLTHALERREAVQATLLRATIHIVSTADYWPLTAAVRRTRRELFERPAYRDIDSLDMQRAARLVREALGGGHLRLSELAARLAADGLPERAAAWLGMYVDLVRVPPSGTWEKRRADLYGLAETWLPRPPVEISEEEGIDLVIRRYVGAFGPAALADIGSWAGLPPKLLRPIAARMDLRRFRDEKGVELLDLPDAPLPPEDTPAPVRFLPTWDATLLVHARRTQILPEAFRPLVFNTRTPHSVPTFLVDGQVAGRWRYEKDHIDMTPFASLPRAIRRELDDEAERLAAFHAA